MAQDRKALERVIKLLEHHWYPFTEGIHPHGAQRILGDNTHPSHSLITLLLSGKIYRFFPQTMRILDSSSTLNLNEMNPLNP